MIKHPVGYILIRDRDSILKVRGLTKIEDMTDGGCTSAARRSVWEGML